MQKLPNDYITKAEFSAAMGGIGVKFSEIDKRFESVDSRFIAIDRRFDAVDQRFNAVDQRFDEIDRRFDSLIEMIGDIAVELTSMNLFMKEHLKQQGVLHTRIDRRLDTLEAV